jgi:MFS family permease
MSALPRNPSRFPAVAWGGAAAMAVAMGIARFSYTPILPDMHQQAGLSTAQAGYLATLNFIGYTLGTLWPMFARRTGFAPGPKTTLRFGLAACLVTTLSMAFFDTFAAWAVLRFVSGLTSALTMIYASALVLDALARAGSPGAAGVHYGGVGFGITLSGLMVLLFEHLQIGWRGMWVGCAVMIALLIPLVLATVARRVEVPTPARAATTAASASTRPSRSPWWLVAAYTCSGTGFIVSGTFLPLIAKQEAATAPWAALCWVLVGLAAVPSNVFWAGVAQRAGSTASLIAQYGLQAVGVLLPVWSPTPAAFLASGVLLGATFMGIVTVANADARSLAPHRTAEMLAMMTAGYSLGQIVGPPLAGLIATRRGSFDGGLYIAAGTLVLGIVFLLVDARLARRAREAAANPAR